MSIFVQFTSYSDTPVGLHRDHIRRVEPHTQSGTNIYQASGESMRVKESYREVMAILDSLTAPVEIVGEVEITHPRGGFVVNAR